jgi:hypothetical protein
LEQAAEVSQEQSETAAALADEEAAGGPEPFALPQGFESRELSSVRAEGAFELAGDQSDDQDLDDLTNQEEAALGTSPTLADTDGDGLLDGWEVHGVNGIDLHAMGASPKHKDIFVEMDFMVRANATNGLGPNANVLAGVRKAFAEAAVTNPDGTPGINIHLETGNQAPYDDDLHPYASEFFAIKSVHFDAARSPVFHYMIWANGYRQGSSSGVSMGIPHSDFIVTLGKWNNNAGGTDKEKIGTFIHELGHNLGLTHGGGDHTPHKPNHISVMNYSFQTRGIPVNGVAVFDYQRFPLPMLTENFLSETAGLGGGQLAGYSTIIRQTRVHAASGAIDWDNDASIDIGPVSVDINADLSLTDLSATPNQWTAINFRGGSIGSQQTLDMSLELAEDAYEPFPYVELTEEMNEELAPDNP